MPTPSDPATGTAAVTLDAVPGDAVAAGPEALPQAAVKPGTSTASQLCIAADNAPDPVLYCRQIFNMPASRVVVVSSWKGLMDEIFKYSRIDTLVLLTHGGLSPGEISLGSEQGLTGQRTLAEWAKGVSSENSGDPFVGLATWPGLDRHAASRGLQRRRSSCGALELQAAGAGNERRGVVDGPLSRHHTCTPRAATLPRSSNSSRPRATSIARPRPTCPRARSAAPTVPASSRACSSGILSSRSSARSSPRNSIPFGDQRFGNLVAMPSPPFREGIHFTRAEGLRNATIVRTPQDAAELQALIDRERSLLYRVIAR